MMRAQRQMPRGVGEWLTEGEGPHPAGCCVITAVEAIRGVRHGCETNFDTTDAESRALAWQIGRNWRCSRTGHQPFCAAASPFNSRP